MFLSSVEALDDPVVVLPHDGPLVTELKRVGAQVTILRFPVLRKVEMRGFRAPVLALSQLFALPRLVIALKRSRATVVYVSTIICPVWLMAGRLAGCRVVCHVHENEPDMGRLKCAVLLAQLRLASRIVANSHSTRDWIGESSRAVMLKTVVVYNGVDSPSTLIAPAQLAGSADRHLVVVGRIAKRKGQDVAIKALHLLRLRGYSVDLTLVGDVFPGYEEERVLLASLADGLGLVDCIHFAGFSEEVAAYLQAADIVLVPSRVEPFGNVAVDAQMAGKPVVASNVQGLPEIVEHGRTGLLVAPDDPAALAAAVARLLDEPGLAGQLAQRGADAAHRRFNSERYRSDLRAALTA
ncbi:MAG: glycosyltransferase family 4 protein [Actinobacteria bacterium]|nr:glycosyltransferase family 4 protein [Actinomycetota bacterium]